jgi:hypothetical protein
MAQFLVSTLDIDPLLRRIRVERLDDGFTNLL